MSEQGWRNFLASPETQDWVILHGGATAAFRVSSLAAAAALATDITALPAVAGRGIKLTLADTLLTVRLTRDLWHLEADHISLASAISAVARQYGASPARALVQEVQFAIAAKAAEIHIDFWRAVLGYAPASEDNAIDPLGHSSTVWMQELAPTKSLRHAMHIDVSVAREEVEARLAAALAAGGRIVDASHAPSHWTLSDPAGNRVCICAWPDGSNL